MNTLETSYKHGIKVLEDQFCFQSPNDIVQFYWNYLPLAQFAPFDIYETHELSCAIAIFRVKLKNIKP